MEEVRQPVVHSAEPRTQLVDAVAQVVPLGPAKLVAELRKTLHARDITISSRA